jgi:mRNA interferase RelE/StbE
LQTLPTIHGNTAIKKLKGEDAYRIRVGNYRVIYEIDDGKIIVIVVSVGHRKDIYK